MNDDLAFIDAILADESDDTTRLVYADWLEDHGEPELAAFVRMQTEVYRTPSADPRRLELRKQETAAWNAYKKKWKAALDLGRIGRGHFTRGVIPRWKVVEFPAPAFVELAGGWGPGLPVRYVHLDQSGPRARIDERLAECPFSARLTALLIGPLLWQRYEALFRAQPPRTWFTHRRAQWSPWGGRRTSPESANSASRWSDRAGRCSPNLQPARGSTRFRSRSP